MNPCSWGSTPEEELAVEVGHVNCVHVYDINVAYSTEGQVLQQLTAKTTCTLSFPSSALGCPPQMIAGF